MTEDPVHDVLLDNAAYAVWLGSDGSGGLNYLRLDDDDRRIYDEILSRVGDMKLKELDYMAHKVALEMWGSK
jgi:hypothetical protein